MLREPSPIDTWVSTSGLPQEVVNIPSPPTTKENYLSPRPISSYAMTHSVWFENSHYRKLRTDLQATCCAQPVLHLRPVFTPTTWASDPFILFENGIRYQLADIFHMLRNTAFRIDTLQISHCLALQKWIIQFGHTVALYFLIQERVLLPQLNTLHPGICSITGLRKRTLPLIESLVSIHASALKLESAIRQTGETNIINGEVYEALRQMSELVFSFAVDCEKLFSWEFDIFVPVMQKATKSCAWQVLQLCVVQLLAFEEGERIFRAYSALLPSGVRQYCLLGVDVFRLRKIRVMERKWSRSCKAFRKQFALSKTL